VVTRRVKTGGAYVGAGGLGAPSPPQWQNTYEDQEFTGAYVADPGGGPDQWQYSGGSLTYYTPVPYYTGANQILAAGLHSNAATADGLADGDTQSTSPDFTASGMDATTAKAARWTISGGNRTLLTSGGRFKYRVDTAGLSKAFVPAAGKYVACGANGYLEKSTTGAIKNKFPVDSGPYKEVGFKITPAYKDTKITVEHCWDATNTWMIIDGLPVGRPHYAALATGNFGIMYAGGLTTFTPYWLGAGYRIDNVTLDTAPFTYTTHPEISSTLFLGDSFTTQGSPDVLSYGVSGILAPWHPGYGFQSDGTTPSTSGSFDGDGNYITEFFRQMSLGGFLVTNTYAANQAVSGARTSTVLTRVNSLGSVPKLVLCGVGTNDCANLAITESAVRSNLRGIVDALIAKGAKRIVFWTCVSLRNDPTYQFSTYDDQTTMVNGVIAEMASYNRMCVVVDLFTPFGGVTPTSGLFQSNNIHPNSTGSTLIGKLMGQAAVASLTGA
jgi:hypothetical protein